MSTLQIDLLSAWRKVSGGASQLLDPSCNCPKNANAAMARSISTRIANAAAVTNEWLVAQGATRTAARYFRLRADTALLAKDFSALAGPLELAAFATESVGLRRGVILTAVDLEKVVQAFERLDHAVMGFRRNCTATEMKRIKSRCFELCFLCDGISSVLEGTSSESAVE